jgi:hypothetical protein
MLNLDLLNQQGSMPDVGVATGLDVTGATTAILRTPLDRNGVTAVRDGTTSQDRERTPLQRRHGPTRCTTHDRTVYQYPKVTQ